MGKKNEYWVLHKHNLMLGMVLIFSMGLAWGLAAGITLFLLVT